MRRPVHTGSATSTGQREDDVVINRPDPAAGWDLGRVAVHAPTGQDRERSVVTGMISRGMTDENRLTNAIFFARHPERRGRTLARGSALAGEWVTIRDQLVRPALSARTTARPGHTTAETTAPEHSVVEQAYDAVLSLARRIYDAVAGDPADDRDPVPAEPAVPATMGAATVVTVPAAKKGAAGEERYRTKRPTYEGSTLDIARTRLDRQTTYRLKGIAPDDVQRMVGGDADATVFYCSGLSIWTLSAAGYDVRKEVIGTDGRSFTWTKKIGKKKNGEDRTIEVPVTLKQLIDGEAAAVEAMSIVSQRKMTEGGSVGFLSGRGFAVGYLEGDAAAAVKGAAGAFEAAHIGAEVPEKNQKPGDFAQSRYESTGDGSDTELRHRGAGHAWQVWSVRATGEAFFSKKKGSPVPVDRDLDGWHSKVKFDMDKDTDPSYVGVHTVEAARRIEANVANKKRPGGVRITGWLPVGYVADEPDYHLYYGRLSTSPWANWDENVARRRFGP
jgi:hypothetical protein